MTTKQRGQLLNLDQALCGGEVEAGGHFDAGDWNFLSDSDVLDRLLKTWVAMEDNVSFAYGNVPGGEVRWVGTFVVPEVCPW